MCGSPRSNRWDRAFSSEVEPVRVKKTRQNKKLQVAAACLFRVGRVRADIGNPQHVGGPGVPSGTPATTMIRCPAFANPSRNAIRRRDRSCRPGRGRLPQSRNEHPRRTASRRPVETFGEIATTSGFGRSRAMRCAARSSPTTSSKRRRRDRRFPQSAALPRRSRRRRCVRVRRGRPG